MVFLITASPIATIFRGEALRLILYAPWPSISQVQAVVCIVEDLKLEPIRAKLASCLDAKDAIAQILGANEQEEMRCVTLFSI